MSGELDFVYNVSATPNETSTLYELLNLAVGHDQSMSLSYLPNESSAR